MSYCENCARLLRDKDFLEQQNLTIQRERLAMQRRIEELERDAARYREFCRQAEERQFPTALLDDAEEMGAGVLDMHFDAAMRGTAEKAGEGD